MYGVDEIVCTIDLQHFIYFNFCIFYNLKVALKSSLSGLHRLYLLSNIFFDMYLIIVYEFNLLDDKNHFSLNNILFNIICVSNKCIMIYILY